MIRPLLAFLILFFCVSLSAQNLETIGRAKPLTVTGGVSLNQIFYSAQGINNRRNPYSYYASGNVNLSLYGWSVPLSFSVSNQNTTFQQPFNQYSMHPTYKWIAGHIGYASVSFSPYTVNGHVFFGTAVDITPEGGKWKFGALYGRFLKAVQPDSIHQNARMPSFRRMGYGFKASYGNNGNTIDFSMFHAKDDVNSIHYVPDSLGILPQENLVVSVGGGKTFLEHFTLKAEVATSAITRDIRADKSNDSNILAKPGFLYSSRQSSSYYNAYKASFNYQFLAYTIGVGYERIDPQYRTLGAYYFNNDMENITANGAATILRNKINVAVTAGTQRDNLDKSKVSTMRRLVGSLNVNYTPSERINLTTSYSSFQTFTNIRSQFVNINQLTPYDNLDTLNYRQISRSASVTGSYLLSNTKERRQNINLNLTYQGSADVQGAQPQQGGSKFYNMNVGYSMNLVPRNITFSLAVNGNINDSHGFKTNTLGPTASVNKSFMERRLRVSLSSSYNNSYTNSKKISTILNGRVSSSYSIKKKHNLTLNFVMVKREANSEKASKSFTEYTGTLGYNYAFGMKN